MRNRKLDFKVHLFEEFLRYGLLFWKSLGSNFSGKTVVDLGCVLSLCGIRLVNVLGICRWFVFFRSYGYGRES
jgi:hypothetical protein